MPRAYFSDFTLPNEQADRWLCKIVGGSKSCVRMSVRRDSGRWNLEDMEPLIRRDKAWPFGDNIPNSVCAERRVHRGRPSNAFLSDIQFARKVPIPNSAQFLPNWNAILGRLLSLYCRAPCLCLQSSFSHLEIALTNRCCLNPIPNHRLLHRLLQGLSPYLLHCLTSLLAPVAIVLPDHCSSPNIYFPRLQSSIPIPPESWRSCPSLSRPLSFKS